MATQKTKTATKPKAPTKNTSAAAVPGNDADVSAAAAAKAAVQAETSQAGQQPPIEETKAVPPAGDKQATAKKEPVAKALIVKAKADGFRRAGRRWSATEETVSIDDFTAEQVEALLTEPMLDVAIVAE